MSNNMMIREDVLKRWEASKATKRQMVEKMRKMLYEDYKLRMGKEPSKFNIL